MIEGVMLYTQRIVLFTWGRVAPCNVLVKWVDSCKKRNHTTNDVCEHAVFGEATLSIYMGQWVQPCSISKQIMYENFMWYEPCSAWCNNGLYYYDSLTDFYALVYVIYRVLTWGSTFTALVAALNDPQDQQRRPLAVTMLKKIGQQLRQANLFRVRTGISQDDKAAALRDFIWQHHAEVGPILTLQIAVWEPE